MCKGIKKELAELMLVAMLTVAGGAGAMSFTTPDAGASACAGDVTIEASSVRCASTGVTLLASCAGDVVIDSSDVIRCSAPSPSAVPSCTLAASPQSINLGSSSVLTATCSPAATSYQWTGTGFPSSASGGSVSPTVSTIYSVKGVNSAGSGNGASVVVTVTAPASAQAPFVLTNAASSVTRTSAQMNGLVDPNGYSTTAYFEYGTTTSYGSVTGSTTPFTSSTTIYSNWTGLTPNTLYYYRAVAINSNGTSIGNDAWFYTLP